MATSSIRQMLRCSRRIKSSLSSRRKKYLKLCSDLQLLCGVGREKPEIVFSSVEKNNNFEAIDLLVTAAGALAGYAIISR